MQVGRLRNRCQLYRRTSEPNEYGEPVTIWTLYGYMWASIEEQTASEDIQADRPVMLTRAIVKTRYRTDLQPTDRFTTGGATWEISSVINANMENDSLVMNCAKTE